MKKVNIPFIIVFVLAIILIVLGSLGLFVKKEPKKEKEKEPEEIVLTNKGVTENVKVNDEGVTVNTSMKFKETHSYENTTIEGETFYVDTKEEDFAHFVFKFNNNPYTATKLGIIFIYADGTKSIPYYVFSDGTEESLDLVVKDRVVNAVDYEYIFSEITEEPAG